MRLWCSQHCGNSQGWNLPTFEADDNPQAVNAWKSGTEEGFRGVDFIAACCAPSFCLINLGVAGAANGVTSGFGPGRLRPYQSAVHVPVRFPSVWNHLTAPARTDVPFTTAPV